MEQYTNPAKEHRQGSLCEARQYQGIGAGKVFDTHGWTNHSAGQYVDYDDSDIQTNTVESIFKRGTKSAYQHCGKQHLHRYAAEFDCRYTTTLQTVLMM